MATMQVNGSAVTTSSTRNNGGAALRVKNTNLVDGLSLGGTDNGFVGSRVLVKEDVAKAVSAGLVAYNNNKPVARRSSTTITGLSNTVLRSGASQPALRRSIHRLESVLTVLNLTAIRAGKFNMYTGKYDAGYPQVVNDTGASGTGKLLVNAAGNYRDTATVFTNAVPGRLTYRTGAKVPVNDTYAAKNS